MPLQSVAALVDPQSVGEVNTIFAARIAERPDPRGNPLREKRIVGGEVDNKLSFRMGKRAVECLAVSNIPRQRKEFYLRMCADTVVDHLNAVVVARIIHYQELNVGIRLLQHGLNSLPDKSPLIVAEAYHSYEGELHHMSFL
jgi:hypothetical protein